MGTKKTNIDKASSDNFIEIEKVNPFKKLMDDQSLIAEAVNNSQVLSTLKGIKFVKPL